jgi:hypothetical protein
MMKTKNKKLKITNYGLTIAKQSDDREIELLGLNPKTLKSANSFFPDLPKEMDLKEQIPLESLFFYKIESYDKQDYPKRDLLLAEMGVGQLVKRGRKTFLDRLHPKRRFAPDSGLLDIINGRPVNFADHPRLIVTTSPPRTFNELFSFKDSVICSLGDGCPEIVIMEENSILGMTDGDLGSLKGDRLKKVITPDVLQAILLDNDLPLVTNSNSLELTAKNSNISSNSICLKPERSRPTNPQAGTIIFNNKSKKFQGYDGTKWRNLNWEDKS